MSLSVTIRGNEAKIMRGRVQVGTIRLDSHMQVQGVVVLGVATPPEAEKIIRLAASHVAQYNVTGRTRHTSDAVVLVGTHHLPAIPGLRREDAIRLLDFSTIPHQHAQLTEVMRSVDVSVERR